jgi:hypothetical protein
MKKAITYNTNIVTEWLFLMSIHLEITGYSKPPGLIRRETYQALESISGNRELVLLESGIHNQHILELSN